MSKITGLHHVAIRALDFDRSVRFYTKTLGLTLKNAWINPRGRACLVEIAQASYMEIFEWKPTSVTGEPAILHFCLRTDDVDGLTERVRADGFFITTEPLSLDIDTSMGPMKLRLSFVSGPDGEEIELMCSDTV